VTSPKLARINASEGGPRKLTAFSQINLSSRYRALRLRVPGSAAKGSQKLQPRAPVTSEE